jgi:hypothetical protein
MFFGPGPVTGSRLCPNTVDLSERGDSARSRLEDMSAVLKSSLVAEKG